MRVLICGGRDYSDRDFMYQTLDKVFSKYGDDLVIIHGSCIGADLMAEEWAKSREVPYFGFPARWKKFKRGAGYERNKRMRDITTPDACIAFKGGRGTKMMMGLMEDIGVNPWKVGW